MLTQTSDLNAVIRGLLRDGVSIEDVPERILSEYSFDLVRDELERLLYQRARTVNQGLRRVALAQASAGGYEDEEELIGRIHADPDIARLQWRVMRPGGFQTRITYDLTADDLRTLANAYRMMARQNARRAKWCESVVELLVEHGKVSVGELLDAGIELPNPDGE